MPAIATTDHGYVFGAYEFWSKARSHGIKPIIGVEAYVTPGTHRRDKTRVRGATTAAGRDDVGGGGAYTHMTLLARTTGGMHNLFRMSSLASPRGPLLQAAHGPRAPVRRTPTASSPRPAASAARSRPGCGSASTTRPARPPPSSSDIFGAGELLRRGHGPRHPHRAADPARAAARWPRTSACRCSPPTTCTTPSAEDAKAHAALLCVQSGSTMMDPNRFKFEADEFYLKTPEQMRHVFRELPEACDNTLLIAERCDVSFVEGEGRYMPRFPCPAGRDRGVLVRQGGRARPGMRATPSGVPAYARGAGRYETDVIVEQGLRRLLPRRRRLHQLGQGQRHPGRSGPRVRRRLDVRLRHADHRPRPGRARPGLRAVPQPRAAVDARLRRRLRRAPPRRGDPLRHREVRRGAGRPDRHLRHHQGQAGGQGRRPGDGAPVRDGREAHQGDAAADHGQGHAAVRHVRPGPPALPRGGRVPRRARRGPAGQGGRRDRARPGRAEAAVGRARRGRDHEQRAAASTSSRSCAASRTARSSPSSTTPAARRSGWSRWTSSACATSPSSTTRMRQRPGQPRRGRRPRGAVQGHDRPQGLRGAGRGDTLGVFQLDGGGTRTLLRQMQPDDFEDISATIALYRPGPMGTNSHTNYAMRKTGRQPVTPIHPELAEPLEEILGATHGLIVYQEQVIQIAQKVAGYTLGRADLLRKAMGKKKKEVLDAEFAGFEAGMQANGYSANAIKTLWDALMPFADYALQQGARQGLRADLLLDRLPQGELPGRVHGRAADQRARRQGQVGALPQRVPPDGDQGPAARRQRVGRQLRRRRHRHPVRDGRDPQRRYQRRRRRRPQPRGEGPVSPRSRTSCARTPAVVCNKRTDRVAGQGRSVRQPRPPARGHRREARPVRGRAWPMSSARPTSGRTACSTR